MRCKLTILKVLKTGRPFFFLALLFVLGSFFHPYYVSVTDIKYKASDKSLQVSCKIFTNDLESTLKRFYKKNVDLLHPKDKKETDQLLSNYIANHLLIKVNGVLQKLDFIGYEKEEEGIWCYFEVNNVSLPKTIHIENSLLYEYYPQQINMVHTEVGSNKKSFKVNNPDKAMDFSF